MRKKLLALVLCLCLFTAAVGCGGNAAPQSSSASEPSRAARPPSSVESQSLEEERPLEESQPPEEDQSPEESPEPPAEEPEEEPAGRPAESWYVGDIPAITVSEGVSGGTVECRIPANGIKQSAELSVSRSWSIDDITFENDRFWVERLQPLPTEYRYFLVLRSEERTPGAKIEDTMTVILSGGQRYSFHIAATVVDKIALDLRDEAGNHLINPNPPDSNIFAAQVAKERGQDVTVNAVVEILDAVPAASEATYQYSVSSWPDSTYGNDAEYPRALLGTVSLQGKKLYVPINITAPERTVNFPFTITVTVQKQIAGIGTVDTVSKEFRFAAKPASEVSNVDPNSLGTVYPKGS